MSRFKPREAARTVESEENRLPSQIRSARPGVLQPLPAVSLLGTESRVASSPQTSAPEKLAFGLNMLFLFLVTSRVIELIPSLSSVHLVVIISVAAGLIAVLNGSLWRTLTSPLGVLFLALTIWFVITVPFSVWRGGSATTFSEWLRAVCMFFLVGSVTVNSRQALLAMRVSAYAYLASGVVALTKGVVMGGRLELRTGSLGNPNYLAAAMCTGIFLWWFILHNPKERWISRAVGVGALAILVGVMVKAGSRGALIALLATVPILIMQYPLVRRLRILAGLALLAVLGVMLAPGVILKRFTVLFDVGQAAQSGLESGVDKSAAESSEVRLSALKRSLEITAQNPLLGVGIGMFAVAENNLAMSQGVPSLWLGTHNTYTQVSSETGIPGLLLFLAILVTDWRMMRSLRREQRLSLRPNGEEIRAAATALWLILLNTMIYAVFDFFAYSPSIPILSGVIFALSRGAFRDLDRAAKAQPGDAEVKTALARIPAMLPRASAVS